MRAWHIWTAGIFLFVLLCVWLTQLRVTVALRLFYKNKRFFLNARLSIQKRKVASFQAALKDKRFSTTLRVLNKKRPLPGKKPKPEDEEGEKKPWLDGKGIALDLINALRIHRLDFSANVGVDPNAAATALLCGLFSSGLYTLAAPLSKYFVGPDVLRVRVDPHYKQFRFDFVFFGIASVKLGKAFYSIFKHILASVKEVMNSWLIRLRTSHPRQWKSYRTGSTWIPWSASRGTR
jgi:hypothetical protein